MSQSHRPRSQRPRRRPQVTWEEFVAARQDTTGPGKEVLTHIYQSLLKTPEFMLQDGTKCRVDALFEPEVNSDGDLKCGFDVLLGDIGHLEFTVEQTGWGRALGAESAKKPRRPGRGT